MVETRDSTKWSSTEMMKMHSIPFFIYQNFENDNKIENYKTVGAMELGNMLLNLSGVKKSNYFYFLDTLNYKALRDRLFVDENGVGFEEIPDIYLDKVNEHHLLQYDILYGKNYTNKYGQK